MNSIFRKIKRYGYTSHESEYLRQAINIFTWASFFAFVMQTMRPLKIYMEMKEMKNEFPFDEPCFNDCIFQKFLFVFKSILEIHVRAKKL